MPIVYIHRVAVRKQNDWPALQQRLRRYVAPVISSDAAGVPMIPAYWGDRAARYRYNRKSLPQSPILKMGAQGPASLPGGLLVGPAFRRAMAESPVGGVPGPPPSQLL